MRRGGGGGGGRPGGRRVGGARVLRRAPPRAPCRAQRSRASSRRTSGQWLARLLPAEQRGAWRGVRAMRAPAFAAARGHCGLRRASRKRHRSSGAEHHACSAQICLLHAVLRRVHHRAHVSALAGRDGPRRGVLRVGARVRTGTPRLLLPGLGPHGRQPQCGGGGDVGHAGTGGVARGGRGGGPRVGGGGARRQHGARGAAVGHRRGHGGHR
mmetsp:Transcript_16624/g.40904  ORF Transcript_16624/g.40904 Transcript_16624/m.40904 type:complete len:212 (-) Transcript_16624:72-707(-)